MKRRNPFAILAGVAALVLLVGCGARGEGDGSEENATSSDSNETASKTEEKYPDMDPTLAACQVYIDDQKIDLAAGSSRTSLPKFPTLEYDKDKTYYWNVETNKGPIKVRLLPEVAPNHVSNTIYLAMIGFYDGLQFHRVIQGFMAQGGCPLGTGSGSPGYRFDGEFAPDVKHDRPGLLSMANAGPGTDGSQFFLTFVPTPWLDNKHTIFGEVAEGMETVKELEKNAGPNSDGNRPVQRLVIEKSTITVE